MSQKFPNPLPPDGVNRPPPPPTPPAKRGVEECHEHLVVKDTFHLVTGKARTMPGDCYCVRCGQPVPYVLRDGKGYPVEEDRWLDIPKFLRRGDDAK